MLVVGLTGGIASGKTTVAKILSDFDIKIVDVDKIAKEVVSPHTSIWEKIRETFGEEILDKDLSIDRSKLAKLIFSVPAERKLLDSITHPIILTKIKEKLAELKNESIVVIDIPLLFETGFEKEVDKVVVVFAQRALQIERLVRKCKLSLKEAEDRIDSQMSLLEKTKKADWIIYNNGGMEELREEVRRLFEELKAKAIEMK